MLTPSRQKTMQSVVKAPVNQDMAIVMSGITKVFIGEVVETGKYNSNGACGDFPADTWYSTCCNGGNG